MRADFQTVRDTLLEDWPDDHPTYLDTMAALDRISRRVEGLLSLIALLSKHAPLDVLGEVKKVLATLEAPK